MHCADDEFPPAGRACGLVLNWPKLLSENFESTKEPRILGRGNLFVNSKPDPGSKRVGCRDFPPLFVETPIIHRFGSIGSEKLASLLKPLARVGSNTLLSRMLGFARDLVFAHVFGSNAGTGAFFVAFKIPNFLRRLFAEGAFSVAFVPVLTEYKERRSFDELKRFVDHLVRHYIPRSNHPRTTNSICRLNCRGRVLSGTTDSECPGR